MGLHSFSPLYFVISYFGAGSVVSDTFFFTHLHTHILSLRLGTLAYFSPFHLYLFHPLSVYLLPLACPVGSGL